MNYQQTIEFLFNALPMFSRVGAAAFRKDLDNTIRLCEALGNPQNKFKSIHIAGTNGKGSTSHMLAAILQSAGYKTGLYTSPHLKDFRERIKVDGKLCSEDFIVDFTQRIQPLIEELNPSFFEITVAMAFEYFARQKVDIAVIEVGLGGRLDSTNIITPELSVITNIGYDHMNMLGDSLDKIAFEKAGIIKKDIPVVIGEWLPETKPVFASAAEERKAPIIFAQENKWVTEWTFAHHHLFVTVADKRTDDRPVYELDLPGVYQTKNVVTVLEVVHQLRLSGWKLDEPVVKDALKQVKRLTGLHGRWELVQENPSVILDVCHNEDGIRQLAQQVELSKYNDLHIVLGMVKDKDISKVLPLLPKNAVYYFTKAQIPRALDETELERQAAEAGLKGKNYPDVNTALQSAKQHAGKEDMIIVCGSVFLVGEVVV
ncbi:folylpolyglutamate synthase/dihydrofolate synthase family protein [Danxiaibacter flavus]|uniref:Dihydrofolate synthase/folylpolyglutamate synthase n=1 Tax=Danxiaibacter flavus TaxID=3049108 RepID=A0ABV3ZLK8_9BACT|nr:folylpolyglutamate synthase/dihydrofolate synthase family protein [Chitinophagaceae bacterium DXS]